MGLPGINFQHEFSAEIDVIKQSYIERNFRPKILFRDVREFIPEDAQSATTAYGANVPIPTVDMLVAGFVCKDLSQLNSHKKGLKDEGESGDTFAAIYSYARNFRPGIVLLENVVNTKELWNDLMLKWAAIGYECQWLYCDTKNYYLPHTRRRMYMIALEKSLFGKGVEQAAQKWKENMEQLRRQCSSPFEAFLVEDHSDQYSYNARTLESDWELCRLRYDRTRSNEQLGIKRPISQWSENGTVRPPDFANRKWYYSQSSRVWDAVDIAHLRAARSDHDSLHKMLAWDVSQNPDRFRTPIGVVGCITPNGCVFVTNRQTALNGSQMLRLQGIQSDKLLLGRESQSELQDLAGNAMSSTVIGTSIISAIITGRKTFRTHISPTEDDVTATIKNLKVQLLDVGSTNTQALSSEKLEGVDVTRLVEDARRSSPLCVCEGHKHVSKSVIHVCGDCKHTACANCSGNPRHNYANLLSREIRILPSDFEKTWRHQLPSRIRFTQFPDFRESITSGTTETWRAIVEQVQEADLHNQWFTMSSFQRDDREWIISYVAPLATLQLQIRESIEWRLYVKCRESEPGISPVRHRLQLPLARGPVTGNLLNPPWEVLFPNKDTYTLSIAGSKSRVASWRSRIGLPDYKSETLPFALDIQSHHQTSNLKAIYGHYTLLPNCGSAMSSLYQRKDEGKPPLYLFLESDPIGSGDKDRFTFSTDFRPLPYGQSRVFSAQLDPSWRPWTMATKVNVKTTVAGTWNTAPISMETDVGSPIQVKIPSPTAMAQYVPSDCLQAVKILDVKINEITHARTFSSYSWALERTRLLPAFNRWNKVVAATGTHSVCSCSPASPRVLWSVDTAGTATAREDQKAAASFERAIKTRRPVLEVHASAVTGGTQVQITMNIVTLVHRARARLPKFGTCDTAWSLDTNYVGKAWEPFEKFHLRSNADDLPYSGPLQLEWELTDAQKRSLAWMRTQEHGKTLQVVEIEEETNAELGWRAQARAQVEIIVRGGVLADLPSFGKTVTTIGLIQSEFEENGPATIIKNNTRSCKQQSNLIEVAATLIVCPKHITKQWRDELESFLGDRQFEEYNTLVIENYQQLGKLSIADMCKARVIIVSWQLVADDNYISELARFAAMPEPTSTHGRAFDAWLDYVDDQMSNRIETLRTTDASSFEEEMVETLQKRLESERFKAVVPLKIRHGSSYKSYSSMSLSAEQTSTPGAEAFPIQKVAKSNGNDDWSSRLCPLLQKFKFNRVVVDEYHYLLEKGPRDKPFKNQTAYAIIKRLHGHKKWILSGTPALASFSDVNQIASLLGGTLGRDVFEAKSRAIEHERRSLADQTEVERFISNIETMTYEWHQGRHCRAKEFLDAFVRQNAPALDHIPCTERLLPIELSDAHRCVYLEQSQHLIAQRMQIKKARQTKADRYDRLNTSLNNSDTAEEALLRSALCFKSMGEGAGLDGLIQKRRDQIEATTRDIQDCLLEAERYEKLSKDKDNHYSGYKRAIKSTNVLGDEDACRVIRRLITAVEQQGINSRNAIKPAKCAEQLKTITSTITSYAQELTLRQRSFRFIEAVQGLLPTISASDNAQTPRCDSPQCEGTASDLSQLFLISHCGHLACEPCLTTRADNECCVHDGCSAPALPSNMINVPELGSTRDGSAGASHGEKLATICRLIQSVSDDDQAIVFVPNEYDIDIVTEALEEHDISHHAVSKSRRDAADIIDDFQKNSDPEERKRVLVLNLGDESAAGV
jgi:site-specific DNA-cytosine methylase